MVKSRIEGEVTEKACSIVENGIQRILNEDKGRDSISQRVVLVLLLWGSLNSDFPTTILQNVLESQFSMPVATSAEEESADSGDRNIKEKWTRKDLSPLRWPQILRLQYLAILIACFEIEYFSGTFNLTSC